MKKVTAAQPFGKFYPVISEFGSLKQFKHFLHHNFYSWKLVFCRILLEVKMLLGLEV